MLFTKKYNICSTTGEGFFAAYMAIDSVNMVAICAILIVAYFLNHGWCNQIVYDAAI